MFRAGFRYLTRLIGINHTVWNGIRHPGFRTRLPGSRESGDGSTRNEYHRVLTVVYIASTQNMKSLKSGSGLLLSRREDHASPGPDAVLKGSTMTTTNTLITVLEAWKTVLGQTVEAGDILTGRDLWPVTAEDGARYVLKRISPWRNLPLADEARVLRHLASHGFRVAEFLPTDDAMLHTRVAKDTFVLMPELASDHFHAAEIVSMEEKIGGALAELHLALSEYPWSANSYTRG